MAAGAIGVNPAVPLFGHRRALFILTHSELVDFMDEESRPPAPVTFTGRKTLVAAAIAVVLIAAALLIRPAREIDDARPPAPGQRAAAAMGLGAPAAAVDLTALIIDREKWLKEHADDEESWAVLGSAYLEQARRTADPGWYPRAEQALKRSLKLRPAEKGNLAAMTGMGALANARRDYGTGKKWGELVRAQSAKQWTAYPVLVDAYSGLGDYKAAVTVMEQLLELRPGLAAGYLKAAQVYRDRGWREDAVASLDSAAAAATSPTEKAFAMHRMGELAWERGEPAEALRLHEGALRTDPALGAALAGRARALAALGRHGEAVRDYRMALGRVPSPALALELGELLESLGRREEAQEPYAQVVRLAAKEAANGVDETVVLGLYEADHGDPAEAVRRLSATWERSRSMPVADALAWALHRAGDDEAALEYAKKAAEPGLRSAEFFYHRAEIERGAGDAAAARRHLQDALRTNPHFSPLRAPQAREALAAVGQPPSGGPENVRPKGRWVAPDMSAYITKPKPKPSEKGR
ncbi:tetratricopeptide repeat protein [Streptomyces antimicrobicus]|uniref:Tetratricopeptide repeat protein n=1 Tax=Streptomyces antimicrobicus TaxID=2883108 RepID=A0ABS8BAZ6_9ACTN|nr:tetratricopeptide repeat protein [Streptomyces antimicrobicus]MCB5181797.1 tetratricopeptide repeat protein [Streptomyces antimicrobicus]